MNDCDVDLSTCPNAIILLECSLALRFRRGMLGFFVYEPGVMSVGDWRVLSDTQVKPAPDDFMAATNRDYPIHGISKSFGCGLGHTAGVPHTCSVRVQLSLPVYCRDLERKP